MLLTKVLSLKIMFLENFFSQSHALKKIFFFKIVPLKNFFSLKDVLFKYARKTQNLLISEVN